MNDEVHEHGARYVFVVLSSAGSVHPAAALRTRYADYLGVQDLFYPERRLQRFAAERGIESIVLGPEMQRYAEQNGAYLHGFANSGIGFGHWNEAGHAFAATLIARHLCTHN